MGQATGTQQAAKSIITTSGKHTWKRQTLTHDGTPAVQHVLHFGALHIGRRNKQRAFDFVCIQRMGSPRRHQNTTQTVCYQHGTRIRQHGFFELHHPIATQGEIPAVLLHTGVAMRALPQALPVARAAVVPAGKKKDCCCHARWLKQLERLDALDHLVREVDKGVTALRGWIKDHAGQTIARRLCQTHVARNHSAEHFVAKVVFELLAHLLL